MIKPERFLGIVHDFRISRGKWDVEAKTTGSPQRLVGKQIRKEP